MTERTTDREAQREATAEAAAHHAGDGCDEDARQTLTHWLAIQNAAVSRLNGENTDLRADVTRVQGFNKEFQDENTRLTANNEELVKSLSDLNTVVLQLCRDVERLEGERDALRTALTSRSQDVHLLAHQGEKHLHELDEPGWRVCVLDPCVSDRALETTQ